MEGNLSRARTSLYITPSTSMSSMDSSPLSRNTPTPPGADRRIVPQLGMPPLKHRQTQSPSSSPIDGPGHTRVSSEHSISTTIRLVQISRSASAAGSFSGKGHSPSYPRSPHHLDQDANLTPNVPSYPSPLGRNSPTRMTRLEPLSEDGPVQCRSAGVESNRTSIADSYFSNLGEHRELTRSTSSMQMRDLRDQMLDLKGKISTLRDRAREDTMKRRSMSNLKAPSPFTAAEGYTDSNASQNGSLSTSSLFVHNFQQRGMSASPQADERAPAATAKAEPAHEEDKSSVYDDVSESQSEHTSSEEHKEADHTTTEHTNALHISRENADPESESDYAEELVEEDELDGYPSDSAMSVYHESLVTPVSHEDREDAFDYEHFFLHSAMGTMSQQSNRRGSNGSYSSNDSVKTARAFVAVQAVPNKVENVSPARKSISHMRIESTDSVSTMATFQTATEGRESVHNSDDEDGDDVFYVHHIAAAEVRTITPVTAKRSTFGSLWDGSSKNNSQVSMSQSSSPKNHHVTSTPIANGVNAVNVTNGTSNHRPTQSTTSTSSSRSFPLVPKRDGVSAPGTPEALISPLTLHPVRMLNSDDQELVERLVATVTKCVMGLKESMESDERLGKAKVGRGGYAGRMWRRRLDAARRVLEGEEGVDF